MGNIILKYKWLIILVTLATTLAIGFQARYVETETDIKKFLPEDMNSSVNMKKIEDIFGGTDMIAILLETDDVLTEKTLTRVKEISRQFSRLDGIDKTISLFETKNIYGDYGAMIVDPAVPHIPHTAEKREALRHELRENDLAYELVVSADFRYTAIMGTVQERVRDDSLIAAVEAILREFPGDEKIHRGGMPYIREYIDQDIQRDMSILLPLALVLILIILYLSFREKRGVFLPISVVILSILFTMGIVPVFGWKLTLISILLPIMLIAIANNYGIHIIARYQELNAAHPDWPMNKIVMEIFQRLKYPVLLTGLTTVGGILGLLAHTIIAARQMGMAAAIGISFALLISLTYLPVVLSLMKKGKVQKLHLNPEQKSWLDRSLFFIGIRIAKHPGKILWGAGILALIASLGIFLIEVDTNPESYFPKKHPIAISSKIINERFGGSLNVAVEFEGDIKNPDLLKRMDFYERELKDHPGVGQVISIASIIRKMSKALNDENEPGYDMIPDSRQAVAQYLELYAMSGDPEDFEQFVNFDYTRALLVIRVNDGSNAVIKSVLEKVESLTENDETRTLIGGYALTTVELADLIVSGQSISLIYAVLVVGILLMIIFRSFAAGIFSSFPLALAILLLFGLMGYLGIQLDIATAMLSSIMIGVGIDYTIHYLWRFREERLKGLDDHEAVIRTLTTTGRGITFNAVSVMIGFSVLFFSTFVPIRLFGFLIVVSILSCLLGALVFVPALILIWKPKFLNPESILKTKHKNNEKYKSVIDRAVTG
jgi:hydrophobe/amphiphile efflux-3 (HAE3) family protein